VPATLFAALQPYRLVVITGDSMAPTLQNLQVAIGRTPVSPVRTGDIVVFPVDGDTCVKRVVAGQGSAMPTLSDRAKILVGNGQVYVRGDNAPRSFDSRHFGPIEESKIELVLVFPSGNGLAAPR
jgi:type IV secretory pathway protease TraF